jgi:type II secretory pathway pseudopilin PulG
LFVIALIGLVSTLAIPGLMRARGAAQSASALLEVRCLRFGASDGLEQRVLTFLSS